MKQPEVRPRRRLLLLSLGIILALGSVSAKAQPKDQYVYTGPRLDGGDMSAEEAAKVEEQLAQNPGNLTNRARMLGYYGEKSFHDAKAKAAFGQHALWIIEHRPKSGLTQEARLDPILNTEAYNKGRELWLKHISDHPDDPDILWNAAEYFLIFEKDLAEQYLLKGEELEPNNSSWSEQLAHFYQLKAQTANYEASSKRGLLSRLFGPRPKKEENEAKVAEAKEAKEKAAAEAKEAEKKAAAAKREAAQKAFAAAESALAQVIGDPRQTFYLLGDTAKAAFEAGDMTKAEAYASQLLRQAPLYRQDWNYGNAIHEAHTVLGKIALQAGDTKKAAEELIESGKTPGSPQLNSFGPSMSLAKALLKAGEREAVLEYLRLCKNFWKQETLDRWIAAIEAGGEPSDPGDYQWFIDR
jgi:hypothetical protein